MEFGLPVRRVATLEAIVRGCSIGIESLRLVPFGYLGPHGTIIATVYTTIGAWLTMYECVAANFSLVACVARRCGSSRPLHDGTTPRAILDHSVADRALVI